jgi:hypothetical protein
MAPQKYRKTALVEAVQWTGQNCAEIDEFINDGEECEADRPLTIETLEGDLTAQIGDWILRGPEGECWPVKGSIFAAAYEAVSE